MKEISINLKYSGMNRFCCRYRICCLFSVKMCQWYKTHSNTGKPACCRYVLKWSAPGIQFTAVPVSESLEAGRRGWPTSEWDSAIFTTWRQDRGLECHGRVKWVDITEKREHYLVCSQRCRILSQVVIYITSGGRKKNRGLKRENPRQTNLSTNYAAQRKELCEETHTTLMIQRDTKCVYQPKFMILFQSFQVQENKYIRDQ